MKICIKHYRAPANGRWEHRTSVVWLVLVIGFSAICCTDFLPGSGARSLQLQNEFFAATLQERVILNSSNRNAETPLTRRVFVRSKSLLVRAAVVEDKLLKRTEFTQLGFAITRDESDADLVLELRHDLLTKYVFSVVDVKSQTVVASGKVSSLGGTVAGKVAKRFVKDMARMRTS